MSRIARWFSKGWLVAVLGAVLAMSALPVPAYALAPTDTATPPAPSNHRLQRAWAREQQAYARLGRIIENSDDRLSKAQALIDRAKANGHDVTALQAALDALTAAVKAARPVYEGGKGIVASHQGFDASGNVVDAAKALQTVQDMHARLKEVRQLVFPAIKALREAVREFRKENRPIPTPTATGG